MSTENEEWRENSYNEENTGAGRDGNKSYNREGGERPYRPSYNREGGDRPYRPRFNPNSEGGERPQRSYGERSYDRPQRPSYNREPSLETPQAARLRRRQLIRQLLERDKTPLVVFSPLAQLDFFAF